MRTRSSTKATALDESLRASVEQKSKEQKIAKSKMICPPCWKAKAKNVRTLDSLLTDISAHLLSPTLAAIFVLR